MKPQVLIVEDEFMVALTLQDIAEHCGCGVVGPYRNLQRAWDTARGTALDAALLDVRIDGGSVFPVAKVLRERKVPFAFVTANASLLTMKLYEDAPVIAKPFDDRAVERILQDLLSANGAAGRGGDV